MFVYRERFRVKRKKKKDKKKNRKHKNYDMWKILTKDGIYCSCLKWICSTKEKYYKSQDEYMCVCVYEIN